MKIRQGFVSNSSSSSFVVMGVEIKENALELLQNILQVDSQFIFDKMAKSKSSETIEDFCIEWLEEVLEEKGIDRFTLFDGEKIVIGNCIECNDYLNGIYDVQVEYEKAKEIVSKTGLSGDIKLFLETQY